MKSWRVTFDPGGVVLELEELQGPPDTEWVVVEAETLELARRKAVRVYAARKVRERRKQLKAEGRCKCSRVNDRAPKFQTCSVCHELRARSYAKRKADGFVAVERDEVARVTAFQQRSRDRKGEIRLEVLLEVRRWWKEAEHTEAFAKRLATEILEAGGRQPHTTVPTRLTALDS